MYCMLQFTDSLRESPDQQRRQQQQQQNLYANVKVGGISNVCVCPSYMMHMYLYTE